jgi:hypothetical protein
MPREGHLEAVFHIFNYLEKRHNSRIVFDPGYPTIDMTAFKDKCDWKSFFGEAREAIPPNAPTPRGKDVDLQANTMVQNVLYCFPEHGADCLVLEGTINDRNQRLWRLVRCYEARHGVPTWATI